MRLTGAALQSLPDVKPTAGQPLTVTVQPNQKEFWDKVTADLKRMPKYEGLAVAR